MWIRIVEQGYEVVSTPQLLAIYREVEGSVSSRRVGMARTNQTTFRRALARGNLTARQRRTARRTLRLHEAIEDIEAIAGRRSQGDRIRARDLAVAARSAATFALFALRHPSRWSRWRRVMPERKP